MGKMKFSTLGDAEKLALREKIASVYGDDGKKYKTVQCVLRNTGEGWYAITDATHNPTGVASISESTFTVDINFNFTASKIGSLIATPDETFAELGYIIGASVTPTEANLKIYKPNYYNNIIGGYIYYNGTSWSILSGVGNVSVDSFSDGTLFLSHDSLLNANRYMGSVTGRDGNYVYHFGPIGDDFTRIKIFDFAGNPVTTPDTNMKLYFTRNGDLISNTNLDLQTPDSVVSAIGNIWVIGVFEV